MTLQLIQIKNNLEHILIDNKLKSRIFILSSHLHTYLASKYPVLTKCGGPGKPWERTRTNESK